MSTIRAFLLLLSCLLSRNHGIRMTRPTPNHDFVHSFFQRASLRKQQNLVEAPTHPLKVEVVTSAILSFAPWLELHHIVVLTDPDCASKGSYTVDFSPADYSKPQTLGKMVLGQDVPGEIRVRWISGPYLASKGYHVVAIDHVGHGQSDHFGNGGPYFNQKFAMVVRNSMDALGWESSHLLCHSMGANVGMVYAATYVEKVEKLMLIEGFGPVTEPAENTVRILRRAIDSERSLKLKNTKPKLYPNLARAVEARQMVVSTYPGQQFLSREAAFALVSRGVSLQKEDGSGPVNEDDGEHITDEAAGPLRFRHDQRLVLPSYNYHTNDHVTAYLQALQAETLLVSAEYGWPMHAAEAERRRNLLTERGLLTHLQLPGSHHLHLDPETAPSVAESIEKFLATTRKPRIES